MLGNEKILQERHAGEQPHVLESARDTRLAGDAKVRHALEREHRAVWMRQPKASGGWFVEAGDAVEHRGLAGAVWTDHRRDLAFARSEGNIVHGHEAAEAHGHVLDREDGRCGHCDVSNVGSPCSAAGGLGSRNVTEGARRETRPRGRRITTATMAAPNTSMRY